jgi:hypothetical protein
MEVEGLASNTETNPASSGNHSLCVDENDRAPCACPLSLGKGVFSLKRRKKREKEVRQNRGSLSIHGFPTTKGKLALPQR